MTGEPLVRLGARASIAGIMIAVAVGCLAEAEPASAQSAAQNGARSAAQADSDARPTGELPAVYMDYSPIFDSTCSELSGEPFERELAVELFQRLDEFREAWDAASPDLLRATVEVAGRPFPFRDIRAALVVCPIRSMSFPLTLNMRFFLAAAHGDEAWPVSEFVELLYHELLHSYTYDLLPPGPTPLILKYPEEPMVVRSHLHVYAVMAMAYDALGRTEEFEAILERDAQLSPVATRVWEIVESEGPEAFVREIREAGATGE